MTFVLLKTERGASRIKRVVIIIKTWTRELKDPRLPSSMYRLSDLQEDYFDLLIKLPR